jgi:hypothetical protein
MSHDGRRGGGLVFLAFVVFIGGLYGGWRLLTDPPGGDVYECTSQTIRAGDQLPSSLVAVDVFNGGETEGVAGRVSTALQARGFRPGAIANSPSSIRPAAVTILTEDKSDPRVQLVAQQFAKVEYRAPDIALGSGVTVLIGDGFTTLKPAGASSITATSDVTVCF